MRHRTLARRTAMCVTLTSLFSVPALMWSQSSDTSNGLTPARLAVYYGYPSLVNGASGDVARAAATFAEYDVVVFGDGLEFDEVDARRMPTGAGREEHARTRSIIGQLRTRARPTLVYGYVDLGNSQRLSNDELQKRVRLWAAMGVSGIFLDEAGFDFGVTRERQNAVIDFIHGLGLGAFVNAFNPDDVFKTTRVPLNDVGGGNPSGLPPRVTGQDVFLLESFQVRLGEPEDWSAWARRTGEAVAYRDRFKTRMFAVTTTTDAMQHRTSQLFPFAWWSAVLWGLDGFGWGEPGFSGASSTLPWRHASLPASAPLGSQFTTAITETADGFERRTNLGRLTVSKTSNTARFLAGVETKR